MSARLTLLSAVVLATACSAADSNSSTASSDEPTTLTILYPSNYDWHEITALSQVSAKQLINLPLFRYDQNGEPVGDLVRSWEHTEDFRTWTYHLRTDVLWHDGVPFTAHDIAFTYDLLGHPELTRVNPEAQSITVLDDSTFTLTRHSRGDPLDTWTVYLPRHLLEGLDPDSLWEWEFWDHPIGNGPYRYVGRQPGSWVELEANPDHFKGKPAIDRIVLRFGGDPVIELRSGKVDVLAAPSVQEAFYLSTDPRFEAYWKVTGMGDFIWWNHGRPPFEELDVRRALTYGIDRKSLARVMDFPQGIPLVDVPSSFEQIARGEIPEPHAYDPDLAVELLGAAGWEDTDGDGVIERGGNEFRFGLVISAGAEPAAVFVQDQYRDLGIAMEIEITDRALLIDRLFAGDFDAAIGGAGGGRMIPILMGTEDSPGAGFQNSELRRILDDMGTSFDPEAGDRGFREMWPIFLDGIPLTPLLPRPHRTVAHVRVKGLRSPDRIWADRNAEHLWVEEGE